MKIPSPDLIRQVEAESVDSQELRNLIYQIQTADRGTPWREAYAKLTAHIDSIITARVAAAYEAGRLAALRAAPADLLKLTRYDMIHYENSAIMEDSAIGDYVRFDDIRALAASQAAPASSEPVAWAAFADNGNIRVWTSAPEDVRKLAESVGMALTPLYITPQAAPAKAEGWQLVPVKPTPEMLHALYVTPDFVGSTIIRHSVDKLPDAYRAMLAAAPSTPAKESTP